jgi:hypothetical protein
MFLHMTAVTILSDLEYGLSRRRVSLGGSVARAKAAQVSMIRLTQSIWTDVNTVSPPVTPPKKTMNIATTLTVN